MPDSQTIERVQNPLRVKTSEQQMRQYLADTVHELRTPLTVVRGASQVLLRERGLSQPEVEAALLGIFEEARRMARMLDHLLCLTRLDAGQSLDPRAVTLSLFLDDFVARYTSAWPERTINVDRSRLNGTQVHVDPDALIRVLINLIDNAARYSASDGAILITGEAAAGTVSITVRDEGPGMGPGDAKRIFERFFRGSQPRARASGGSGLGLAIVQALIRESHGEIGIETGLDRGTSVTVTLPRLQEPAA